MSDLKTPAHPIVIVTAGARSWIGRLVDAHGDCVTLDPGYDHHTTIAIRPDPRTGRNEIMRPRHVLPIEGLVSCRRVLIRFDSLISETDLDEIDQKYLHALMAQAEDIRKALQAARAGIELPKLA